MKRVISFLFAVVAFAAALHPAYAQNAFVLGEEYDGHTVACQKLEEATKYVSIAQNDADKATEYFNAPDNSCYRGVTKFKMERVVSTHKVGDLSITLVVGKVYGGYVQTPFGYAYSAFDAPDTVHFIVASPVNRYPGPSRST